MVSNVAMTRAEAAAFATSVGGYLACINDAAENLWITQTFLPTPPPASMVFASTLWIGLSDAAVEGTWAWDSGEPVTFTNWSTGEPNDFLSGQDYAVIWTVETTADGDTWDDIGAPSNPGIATRALVEIPNAPLSPSPNGIGWNGHTYVWGTVHQTYTQARASAIQAGGYLVTINSIEENLWISFQLQSHSDQNYWIGLNDEVIEGTWTWDSGEPVLFTNWGPLEPWSYGGPNDYCIFRGATYAWNSAGRTWSTTDNFGYPTYQYGLFEFPPTTQPTTITFLPVHDGHQYMLCNALLTWSEAQSAATAAGGYLVSVNTAAENLFLSTVLLPGATTNSVWMGQSDAVLEGAWVWESGETSSFTNWALGQPDDFGTGQDFGVFKSGANNANGWTWDDEGGPGNSLQRANAIIEIPNLTPPTLGYPATWNGHQYFMTANNMTHPQARALAKAMGGYLACPTTGEENLWITNYYGSEIAGSLPHGIWLGGSDELLEGTWKWDSGELWQFSYWASGQPSGGNSENALQYNAPFPADISGRRWGDREQSQVARALIEIPPAAGLKLECHPHVGIGDPVHFSISPNPGAPIEAYRAYVFDVGLTGTDPGLPVPGMGTIPLNGPYLGILFGPLLPSVFQNFIGLTNANGEAFPAFNYPFVPGLIGTRFYAAVATFAPTANGLGALTNGASFTYVVPAPEVTSGTPNNGTVSGGTVVTFTGSRFMPGISIKFDGVPATNVAAAPNGLTVICTTPPHIVGVVDVVLQNPQGGLRTILNAYTYTPNGPGPVIISLTPATSPIAGGGSITVNGTSFEPTSVVRVDGTNFTTTFVSATALSFTAPAHALGAAGISVYNIDGQLSSATALVYIPDLSFTGISEQIPAMGATVTLTGDGFQEGMSVDAGGVPVQASVLSTLSAIFVMPAGVACNSSITITNPSGQSAALPFNPPPTIGSAFFNFGPATGGSFFGFGGTNFVPGTSMTIDGIATPCFTGAGGTQLGAYAPAYTGSQPLPYTAPVVITSPSGCTVTNTFTYN